ncbi:MAG: hypothetical protein J6Y62_00795 [Clostridia bacterium]|nr:hypothetical protein [Clostridia bacterium]
MKTICFLLMPLLLAGCVSSKVSVGADGRLKGVSEFKNVQQIEFHPDGTVKEIQLWRARPRNSGWCIIF